MGSQCKIVGSVQTAYVAIYRLRTRTISRALNVLKMSQRASSRYLNFSNDEDAKLINIVEQNRPLYDMYDKDHKYTLVRNHLWVEVAIKMGRSVSECKKRWRSMKDTYYRQKKTNNRSHWILMKRLQFLDNTGRCFDGLTEATSDHQDESLSIKEEEINLVDENTCAQCNTTPKPPTLEGRQSIDNVDPYNPDSASESKNKPLQAEEVIKVIEQFNREKMGEDVLNDPLFAFFHSMALAVKKLPPELIAEARVKICSIVGNLEVRALRNMAQQEYLKETAVKIEKDQEEILENSI